VSCSVNFPSLAPLHTRGT